MNALSIRFSSISASPVSQKRICIRFPDDRNDIAVSANFPHKVKVLILVAGGIAPVIPAEIGRIGGDAPPERTDHVVGLHVPVFHSPFIRRERTPHLDWRRAPEDANDLDLGVASLQLFEAPNQIFSHSLLL
jgi:hypothetical protein